MNTTTDSNAKTLSHEDAEKIENVLAALIVDIASQFSPRLRVKSL